MPAEGEGEWAAWLGLASTPVAGRNAVVLVSISVTVLNAPRGAPEASDEIAARLRARHPEGTARIEQFTTTAGNPAVAVRRTVTQRVNGRDVTTGTGAGTRRVPEGRRARRRQRCCPRPR